MTKLEKVATAMLVSGIVLFFSSLAVSGLSDEGAASLVAGGIALMFGSLPVYDLASQK